MRKSFKYRIELSKTSEKRCLFWLDCCRILYNLALEQRVMVYKQSKKSLSYYDQQNQLPEFKKEFLEFKLVFSQTLTDVLIRLDRNYKGFFSRCKQGKGGFPRFKSKDRYNSFTLTQYGWKLKDRYLWISGIGKMKLYLSRPIEGKIKTVTIKRTLTNKWFVIFSCDEVLAKIFPTTDKVVGIDVGLTSFAVDSDGKVVDNPKFLKQALKELKVKQRILSRRKKGSKRRQQGRLQVAKIYEKVANQRKDFLHKTANYYINGYKRIVIEDLNIDKMVQNKRFSRSISDTSWGLFFNYLSYKAESAGRELIKVNPKNTSQVCSRCGELILKKLSQRIHSCPNCGLILSRDENAAKNILARAEPPGLKLQIRSWPENFSKFGRMPTQPSIILK